MLRNRLRFFFQSTLGFLIVAYALLVFALDHPRVQRFLAQNVEVQLEQLLHSDVEIGRIEIGLLNSIHLHNVLLRDQAGKPLLKSQLLMAKAEIYPLLQGRIVLRNIALIDTDILLYQTRAKGPTNFQYILDAFKSSSQTSSSIDLRINSLLLRRCQLRYDAWHQPLPMPGRFSPHHLALHGIDAHLSLKALTPDSLNLRVRHLSAREASGLQLRNLQLRLAANRREAVVQDFLLLTPHSRWQQEQIVAHYTGKTWSEAARNWSIEGRVENARLATHDVLPFVPQLKTVQQVLHLSADYRISPTSLQFNDLDIQSQTDAFTIQGDFLLGLHEGRLKHLNATKGVVKLRSHLASTLYTIFLHRPYPSWLEKLGDVRVQGKGAYHAQRRSHFSGEIFSELGPLKAQVKYDDRAIETDLKAPQLRPNLLLEHAWMPTQLNMELKAKVNWRKGRPEGQFHLQVPEGTLRGHTLKGLLAQGSLLDDKAWFELRTNDPNAQLSLKGTAQLDSQWFPHQLQVSTEVQHFVPSFWGVSHYWGNAHFAFEANVQLPSLSLKQPEGSLQLRDLFMTEPQGSSYHLKKLSLTASPHARGTQLSLRSDFADADIIGPLSPEALRATLLNQLDALTQQLHPGDTLLHPRPVDSPSISFALRMHRSDFLQRVARLNISLSQPLAVEGTLATDGSSASLTASVPTLSFGQFKLNDASLALRNEQNRLSLLAKAKQTTAKSDLALEVTAHTEDKQVYADIQWRELTQQFFYGKLETRSSLQLPEKNQELRFTVDVLPTSFTIHGNTWNVHPSKIRFDHGQLDIANFTLAHSDQMVSLTGAYAHNSPGIALQLRKVDVSAINLLTGLEVVTFQGRATGNGLLRPDEKGAPLLTAQLDIPQFRFNNTPLGHAQIQGRFEGSDQSIHLDALMREGETARTKVEGEIGLGKKRIDLLVEGENTPVAFLNHYISDIFEDIRGRSTGHCRIFGSFKNIDFEGRERATASLRVPVTGVTYHAHEADILVKPGEFRLLGAQLTDSLQGSGSIQGVLSHRHLHDMRYDFSVTGHNIKLYDRAYEVDMPFYATAFGSGDVRITGHPGQMNANISVVTEPGSVLTYILDQPETADQQLLTLQTLQDSHQAQADSVEMTIAPPRSTESSTNIRLNMEVDVRPSSTLRLITDIKSGDILTVHGEGPIQANYYNKGGFQMFGTYTVRRGTYDLSIQNIIKKTFTLLPNGTVDFSGDPLDANVDVHASYMVNSASLADLNIGAGFANNTTPVNCLIDFSGKVSNMQLALDFDLPNVGEDEKAMVRQLIASDEDRTMQVLYLLGVGRFFTYNYATTQGGAQQSQSEVMMKSLLASTLSSQLTNILSNALGTSNWSLAANVATGQLGWNDMEVDGMLSGRLLNNRLLVNGKVGYHEREAATTNFVGDFDVHYLLTPTGNVSLKAYSETNDRYFSKSTLTTQGVGLQVKRDFNSFLDLFRRKRKPQTKQQK